MKFKNVLEGLVLTIISCTAAVIVRYLGIINFGYFVGISSDFLYEEDNVYFNILRVLAVFLCSLSKYSKMVLNPLFIIHIADKGNDVFFVALLSLLLSAPCPWLGSLALSSLRHLFVSPYPGINLLWLFDSHAHIDFRTIMRCIVVSYQLIGIFILRHYNDPRMCALLYFIFDPCGDWASISLVLEMLRPLLNVHKKVGFSFALFAFGFAFCQASFYSWWTVKVGNANFAMIGAIICAVSCIIVLVHLPEYGESERSAERCFVWNKRKK